MHDGRIVFILVEKKDRPGTRKYPQLTLETQILTLRVLSGTRQQTLNHKLETPKSPYVEPLQGAPQSSLIPYEVIPTP